jgi:hypothetical protein
MDPISQGAIGAVVPQAPSIKIEAATNIAIRHGRIVIFVRARALKNMSQVGASHRFIPRNKTPY